MKSRAEIPSVIEIAPEEVRDLAKRLREHPEEAVTESFDFSKLPNLYHYKVMDVLTIFYRKYQHCKDEDSKESLLRMMASKINKRYVSQTGSSLTHLQEITAHFLTDLLMMDQLTETNVNFEEYQFLLDTLGNQINTFGDKNDHNTPLMWGIANTSYSSVLLFISSIEKKGYLNQNSIDTHCTSYGRGSALFLACCKGENHRADQLLLAFAGAGMKMEPIIKKLLQSGASPTDKSDSTEKYSPIDIMVMRRSPEMLQLMIRHLKKPLTSEEIDTLRSRLKLSYAEIDKTMNKYGVVYTLPSRITWHQNLKNINQILDDIDPRIALTSKFKDIKLQYSKLLPTSTHTTEDDLLQYAKNLLTDYASWTKIGHNHKPEVNHVIKDIGGTITDTSQLLKKLGEIKLKNANGSLAWIIDKIRNCAQASREIPPPSDKTTARWF